MHARIRLGLKMHLTCNLHSFHHAFATHPIHPPLQDGIRWRQEYPKYKKANIDKHGILETGDLAYLFVHQTHPAIALLRANKDLLGSDIDAQQKIDNEWYKVCHAPLYSLYGFLCPPCFNAPLVENGDFVWNLLGELMSPHVLDEAMGREGTYNS